MQARFKGEPQGDRVCVVFGAEFAAGEWVECDSPKLATNPMFETRETPKPQPKPAPVAAPKPVPAPAPPAA